VKAVFSLHDVSVSSPVGPTALYVNLNAKKVAQIRKLVGLCKKHKLAEVRVRDSDVLLFDHSTLTDNVPADPQGFWSIWQSNLEQAFPAEACVAVPGKFVLPCESLWASDTLADYVVELVAYDDEFFWSAEPQDRDAPGQESILFKLKQLDALLKCQVR